MLLKNFKFISCCFVVAVALFWGHAEASCFETIRRWNEARESVRELPFLNKKIYPWAHVHLSDWEKIRLRNIPISEGDLRKIEIKFSFKDSRGDRVSIRIFLFRDSEESKLVLVIVPYRKSKPLGFFARRIVEVRKKIIAEGKGIYLNAGTVPAPRLSEALIEFAESEIYPMLNVSGELIRTDYIGRYHWANVGFKFAGNNSTWYKFNAIEKVTSVREVAQYNFRRFLRKNSLRLNDLILPRSKNRISDLQEPSDFSKIVARDGRKLRIRPFIGDGKGLEASFGPETDLDIGKAFMLSYNLAKDGEDFWRSRGGTKFNTYTMPSWWGFRTLD